jgi:TetR/AcrR family transcriptional regulator, transcriptional repressor of bet genes
MTTSAAAAKPRADAPAGPERALRRRRRLQLLNACIAALHQHGPSRTTIDRVVAIADMSPGIVGFYFDSKDAMLVAVLQHVADEFEEHVLKPVAALAATPVQALESLVERYLDPVVASPAKVAVWFAFWSETNSRADYHRICGQKDQAFAALVTALVRRLLQETGGRTADADSIALGLIGALDILWQGILLQSDAEVDYATARRRGLGYLRAVFPQVFSASRRRTPDKAAAAKADAAPRTPSKRRAPR